MAQNNQELAQGDANPEKAEAKSHPTAEQQKPSPSSTSNASREQPEKSAKLGPGDLAWWIDTPVSVFSGLLFVVTTGLVVLGCLQFNDSRILQRAYLSVDPLGIRRRNGKLPFFAHVGIRNGGRLPARNVAWFIRVEGFSKDNRWSSLSDEHESDDGGTHVIPASGLMRRSREVTIDPRFIEKARKGLGPYFLFVWGQVDYTDGFGWPRFTKFCHRYNYAAFEDEGVGGGCHNPPEEGRHHEYGSDAD
jgi:hypothetical protein